MSAVHRAIAALLALPLVMTPVSCSVRAQPAIAADERASLHRFIGTAMGCRVEISVDEDDPARARAAARAAQLELDRLDDLLSDWKSESELSKLNRSQSERVAASADLRSVLARAIDVAHATGGRYDPTVGPAVLLWRASRATGRAPTEPALQDARARVGFDAVAIDGDSVVRTRRGVTIDFGGIGKGYGAVRALEVLADHGCPRALVSVAGDIAAGAAPRGARGWRVEIAPESPDAPSEQLVVAEAAVSTSGGAAQWVEIDGVRRAHIVDPRTGLGATSLAQATVVGPLDAAVDALGTALALTESDADAHAILRRFPGYRARLERDGVAHWLDGS